MENKDSVKIGILGASAVGDAIKIVSFFPNAQIACVFDLDKNNLEEGIASISSRGYYAKPINNSDDFYSQELDAVFAGKNMYEYIRKDVKTLLVDGDCDKYDVFDGLYIKKEQSLFVYENKWIKTDFSKFSPKEKILLLKADNEASALFFQLISDGGSKNGR